MEQWWSIKRNMKKFLLSVIAVLFSLPASAQQLPNPRFLSNWSNGGALILQTEKGFPNGVASLDSSGFVPTIQLPPSITGGLAFQGNWNASTNTPALVSSTGTAGQYFFVSVAGSTTLNGTNSWAIGDLVLFSSGVWNKIPGPGAGSAVTSVAGLTGAITAPGLLNALGITPFSPMNYGAVGDCITDDSGALASAVAAASPVRGYVLADRCFRVASNRTFGANFVFTNNGSLSVDTTKTVTLLSDIQAPPTAQIFVGAGSVVASAASFVSVAWWGALVNSDPAPAFRAAIGSNREYYVPPALYTFKSYTTGFIGATSPGGGLVSTVAFFNGLSRFNVRAYGARFQMDPSAGAVTGACSCMFFLNSVADFTWKGGEYIGNKSNITSGSATNVALVNHNAQRFEIADVYLSGNFGSQPDTAGGTGITGEYEIDGVYRNISMDAVGAAFDMAFLRNVRFDGIRAKGANFSGSSASGAWGDTGFSVIYDPPGLGYNTTGATFTQSDNVKVVNSRFENFNKTVKMADGTVVTFDNDYFVGGNATPPPFGFYIRASGVSNPDNVTVTNSTISGFNYGAYWYTTGMAGVYANYTFSNNSIQGNIVAGFDTDDTSKTLLRNILIAGSNRYFSNTADITPAVYQQTIGNHISGAFPMTPVLAFGGGSTGITYSTQQGLCQKTDRQVVCEISTNLTSKGSSTGGATVTGFPWAQASPFIGVSQIVISNAAGLSSPSSYIGGTTLNLLNQGATGFSGMADTNFTNTTTLGGVVSYMTN